MILIGCDYCNEKEDFFDQNLVKIPLSRRPNDEDLQAELCRTCLIEIVNFAITEIRKDRDK